MSPAWLYVAGMTLPDGRVVEFVRLHEAGMLRVWCRGELDVVKNYDLSTPEGTELFGSDVAALRTESEPC